MVFPHALVAQGIEQPPPKRQATRSNRVEGTSYICRQLNKRSLATGSLILQALPEDKRRG